MLKNITLTSLKLYKKYISPLLEGMLGHACRFTPTCSEYTIEAVERKGMVIGLWLGFRRFLRCNPSTKPGYDPLI